MNNNLLYRLLKTKFGYDTLRPMQEKIICHTIDGGDFLGSNANRRRQTLCFQISALAMDGMAVIVSPLISLMKDQVEALKANGIAAEALNSSNDEGKNRDIINRCLEGKVKLLYISPKRLVSGMMHLLQKTNVSLFAISTRHIYPPVGVNMISDQSTHN